MNVRRSVTQGFPVNNDPTASSRQKSLSTGFLFRSNNDILRDVTSSHEASSSTSAKPKRARSSSPQEIDIDDAMVGSRQEATAICSGNLSSETLHLSDRPIKPLRKSARALMQTQSLPVNLWPHRDRSDDIRDQNGELAAPTQGGEGEEEEDWSTLQTGATSFEPMVLS
ncbi:hypothetical protein VNI00_005572 [Paramarasmius palmivorus]|uniref:Uncharacterized protein n=1 Tax=Paramarasmius palmivorus TaxID=297713 RepID=A0AAW0DAZ5_9AGAR